MDRSELRMKLIQLCLIERELIVNGRSDEVKLKQDTLIREILDECRPVQKPHNQGEI